MKHIVLALVSATAAYTIPNVKDRGLFSSQYAPVNVTCPTTPLNRLGTNANPSEAAYIASRQAKANVALANWIRGVDPTFDTSNLPIVAFTASGGGYRAMLQGAGVVQGFDSRDSNLSTSGLFQGFTYFGGLSGGSWLLSSLAGNDWPTVSNLRDSLWANALANFFVFPGVTVAPERDFKVVRDIKAKADLGFVPTIADPWGRLVSYQLLKGSDGGVAQRLSGLSTMGNFTTFDVPFPILTSVGVTPGACAGPLNSTQFEFTPYEFGSWEAGINAFTQTAFLGTQMNDNNPATPQCVSNFDNLGFVLGTSSDYFGGICGTGARLNISIASDSPTTAALAAVINAVKGMTWKTYAIYNNPFYNSATSPLVSAQPKLRLTDGGLSQQNNPIWPFLQTSRNVSVMIISDNSADTDSNLPDGSELYNTYLRAQEDGLTKMPAVPPPNVFLSQGLSTRAIFFGCNDPNALTIVWMPNVAYIHGTNTSTRKIKYSKKKTSQLIANGNLIATQNGTEGWPFCLACAMQQKTNTTLPAGCTACFKRYCWAG